MKRAEKQEYLAAVRSLQDIYMGNFENEAVPRNAHNDASRLHLVAGLYVYNPVTRKFLVQQRSTTKKTFPGQFTDSASGHIMARAGMTLDTIKQEMCRELAEEVGIEADPGALFLWTFFQDPSESEIKFIFVATSDATRVTPDLAEVTDRTGWYEAAELRSMLGSERFVKQVVGLWDVLLQNEAQFSVFMNSLVPWQNYWNWSGGLRDYLVWRAAVDANVEDAHRARRIPLFLGRFQPFHRGHLRCLEAIRQRSGDVIAGIGSAQYSRDARNPLTYDERRDLMQHCIDRAGLDFEHVFFVPIPDVHQEHVWMQNIKLLLGDNVYIHSNNDWVRGLGIAAGIHVADKVSFEMATYNGSRVRDLVRGGGNWQALVPDASYMSRRGLVTIIQQSMK
ncbi:MAG: adenylyltransferase/cytidyltransferase family protein [Candidatus Lokiarchaeota archaeon]|nr:adenylyltransferase/cytidyltransferase family protein [Candidatus Lokiarchaeota archaeon]